MASTTYEHFSGYGETVTKRHQFASIGNMVRNAGQLPQPFWLGGAACGGGSRSAAHCAARTLPTANDCRYQKRTAWEGRP